MCLWMLVRGGAGGSVAGMVVWYRLLGVVFIFLGGGGLVVMW